MGLFGLFKPRAFSSLANALAAPARCQRLYLFAGESLEHTGTQWLSLSRLQELHIQGDTSKIFHSGFQFGLPSEIGRLQTLQRLVLLNLPIDFPEWIANLTNLRYLMVRGTDLTSIPTRISELKQLHTLRVENCDLATLPATLPQMSSLRELGLVDTRLLDFSPAHIPPSLKYLDLIGSACMTQPKLAQLQAALKDTRVHPFPDQNYLRQSPIAI